MHITDSDGWVPVMAEELHAQNTPGGEIHVRGAGRHLVRREKRSAIDFEVRRPAAMAFKVPLQHHGIDSCAESIAVLENKCGRNRVHRVFEVPTQRTGTMRLSQYPSITQTEAQNPRSGGAAGSAVPATDEHRQLVIPSGRALLSEGGGGKAQQERCGDLFHYSLP